jgi:hypothetical protein
MARAQRTKALKILKSRTFLTGYGVVVKLKCRHPAKQKVGCGRTSARNGAELGSGHGRYREPSDPLPPPQRISILLTHWVSPNLDTSAGYL